MSMTNENDLMPVADDYCEKHNAIVLKRLAERLAREMNDKNN